MRERGRQADRAKGTVLLPLKMEEEVINQGTQVAYSSYQNEFSPQSFWKECSLGFLTSKAIIKLCCVSQQRHNWSCTPKNYAHWCPSHSGDHPYLSINRWMGKQTVTQTYSYMLDDTDEPENMLSETNQTQKNTLHNST